MALEVLVSAPLPVFLPVTVALPTASFLKARRYTLVDALNTIPELLVEVFSPDQDIDMADLVGQPATATFEEPAVPSFDGIVRHVEQRLLDIAGVSVYALTIVPRLWLLTQRRGHRIFQNKTALQIVGDVLAPYGPAMELPVQVLISGNLPVHEYRVQYGESDHDFVFRILAEEGLVSRWSNDGTGRRVWTITDDTAPGAAEIEVPYSPGSGALAATGPRVLAAAVNARLCASEAKVRDYDYRNPALLLERRSVSAETSMGEGPLVHYSHAIGRFEDEQGGDRLAQVQLEQARARSRSVRWETSFALRAGMKVRMHDHLRDDANGDFLVVRAWSEVDLSTSKHVAEVVPAGFPWRPQVPPKARIHGTETAFVVGAPGKEIDVDDMGRVEVEFRWDTRDLHRAGASRRVRVAGPWAGPGRGFWTLPRVGDEVVIAYSHGDPDQPLVIGSVHNGASPVFLPLPEHETRSAWVSRTTPGGDGYNYVIMDDLQGAEILALRAQRDYHCDALRRSTTTVGENSVLQVTGSQSVAVGGGQSTNVGGDMTVRVAGAYYLNSAGMVVGSSQAIDMCASGNLAISSTDGERIDKAAVKHHIESPAIFLHGKDGVQVVTDRFHLHAGAEVVLQVGGSVLKMTAGCIELSSPLIKLNS